MIEFFFNKMLLIEIFYNSRQVLNFFSIRNLLIEIFYKKKVI